MAEFILDASVAISWCFPGDASEDTPYTRGILERLAFDDAIVPEIWPFEIANSIFVSFNKRKRITEHQIIEYLELLRALPIKVQAQAMWANVALESLSRHHNLTAYDVAYLDLAFRTKLPLATSDEFLKETAIAAGLGVL